MTITTLLQKKNIYIYIYFPDCCYIVAVVSHEPNNLVDSLAGGMPSLAHEGLLDCTCQTIEGVDAIPSRILSIVGK